MNPRASQITTRLATFGGVLAGVSMLYVFSSGPALWWATRNNGWATKRFTTYQKYYRPIIALGHRSAGVKVAMDWYLRPWDHPRYYVY